MWTSYFRPIAGDWESELGFRFSNKTFFKDIEKESSGEKAQ